MQEALLKILEGSVVNVPPKGGRKHPEQKLIPINTRHMLFICGGAFEGIERIIESRLKQQNIGFKVSEATTLDLKRQKLLEHVTGQDLRAFGLIPEIVGRLPVVAGLEKLTVKMLRQILTTPKNALVKQYQKLFAMDGVELTFEDEALDYIAQKALDYGMGARSLRGIMEAVLNEAMFDIPSQEGRKVLVIDKAYIISRIGEQKKAG